MSNQQFPSSENTILLGPAETITANWRGYIGQYEPADEYIRAFNIDMSDIDNLSLFQQFGCTSVRAYIAMGTPGVISSLRIILVPVDANGKDVLSIKVPGDSVEAVSQSAIYDLTTPCPQICDVDSPLFD